MFTKIYGFPDLRSTVPSNPKLGKPKDDAMVGIYPLACPKLIISLTRITKARKSFHSAKIHNYVVLLCFVRLPKDHHAHLGSEAMRIRAAGGEIITREHEDGYVET